MKKRKILIVSFIAILGLFLTTNEVNAADSEANITFDAPEEGAEAPDVLDPSDPTTPYDPDPEDPTDPQDDRTGETGPLTLDFVSSIDFGEEPISADNETYESTTLRPFIQVTDRRGTGEGWDVTAQMSEFSNAEGNTLPGAELSFTNGEVVSNNISQDTSTPTPNSEIALAPGEAAANVVTAEADEGLGSWITRWFPTAGTDAELNDNVTLDIPAGAATEGDHTATITWELTSDPTTPIQ